MARWTVVVAVVLCGCGASPPGGPTGAAGSGAEAGSGGGGPGGGGGGGSGGGGSGGEGGEGGEGGFAPGPVVNEVERLGAWLPGEVRSVLPGDARVLVGTRGMAVERPELLGLDRFADGDAFAPVGGMEVLDPATGAVRVLGAADGLPLTDYEGQGDPADEGPSTIVDMIWLERDVRFAAATLDHVFTGTFADDGELTVEATTLSRDGSPALVGAIALAGTELWAGTDRGLAVLDPDTLLPLRWIDLDLQEPWIYQLSIAQLGAAQVVAVLHGPAGTAGADRVALVPAGGDVGVTVALPATGTTVAGMVGSVLVGLRGDDGRGSIAAIVDGDAPALEELVPAEVLARASDTGPFVPSRLAYDAVRGWLVVGGSITSTAPARTGGLVRFEADPDGFTHGEAAPVVPRPDRFLAALPWQVDILTMDGEGRWYVSGRQLCNAHKTRTTGLYRLELDAGGREVRLVRPWVSGVRSIALEPGSGDTWLGLRNELSGLGCQGFSVQQGICRLKADGSCEIWTPPSSNDDRFAAFPGAAGITFGGEAGPTIAVATLRDATYVIRGDQGLALATQIDPGISLEQTGVRVGEDGAVWLPGAGEWGAGDTDAIHDRSPRGLGWLPPGGSRGATPVKWTRALGDDEPSIPGLPSDWVHDVLPLSGSQHALVATGLERLSRATDHHLAEAAPGDHRGGTAEVMGAGVTPFTSRATFGDVVALTEVGNAPVALDAERGIYDLDVLAHRATRRNRPAWSAPERATGMAAQGGVIAVGTTRGVLLYGSDGGVSRVDVPADRVWSLAFVAPGVLYAGTDQGLLRVSLGEASLPARGPQGALPRDPFAVDTGCYGEPGCACWGVDECAAGASCTCRGPSQCFCEAEIPFCTRNPGGEGCSCEPSSDTCSKGLACGCQADGSDCTCTSTECSGESGCPCSVDADCESGVCGELSHVCEEDPACQLRCTCATPGGCPEGFVCDPSGIAGKTCRPE